MKKAKKKISFVPINLFVVATVFIFGMMLSFFSSMEKATEDYVEVDVTIDDVSFESNGSDYDDEDGTVYKFKMNRILHFTYNGKEYDINDTRGYESSNPNYTVELKTNYKDDGVYKIDPDNPRSYSVSYVDMEVVSGIVKTGYIILGVIIAGLVIFDVVYLLLKRKQKKDIFE